MKRKITILLIAAMTITLAACGSKVQERKVIKKGDKPITVLEAESKANNEELKVKKVGEYKNIDALEWQDEDKLLISQENKNNEIQNEGTKYYAENLFIFDTSTEKAKVLREESSNHRWAEFSPDKKHILFRKNNSPAEGFYIMDSQGQNEVSIIGNEEMLVLKARWVDNKNVIYIDENTGVIYEADISGKIVKIADLKASGISEFRKIGDQIYYVSGDDDLTLLKYNLTINEKSPVDKHVSELFPATDENRIAYTKNTDTYQSQLIVCDKNFNNKKIIAEDQMISGVKWSPDNTKLLYLTCQGLGTDGINVADLKTGKTTRVALNTGGESHLSWSPSGKKFVVSQFSGDGTKVKSIVYTFVENTKTSPVDNNPIITLNNTNYLSFVQMT